MGARSVRDRRAGSAAAVRRHLVFVLLALASASASRALDPSKQIGQYGRDSWTSQRGLPGETVYELLQSADGYLWMRTGSGLVRFDGVRFVSMDAQMGGESVRAIALGGDGELLMRTTTRTLVYKNQRFSDYLPPAALPDGGIRIICEGGDHTMLVGADNSLYQTGASGPRLLLDHMGWVSACLDDHAGGLQVGASGGLYTYSHGVLVQQSALRPEIANIFSLMQDHLHRLWVGTSAGLYRIEVGRAVRVPIDLAGPSQQVNALVEDRQGNIWAGTDASGLARISPDGSVALLDSYDGLTDNRILSLFEDREGSLWIGTASGLDRLRDTKLTPITVREGLPANNVKSVVAARDGGLYAFCERGGLARVAGDAVTVFDKNAQLPSLYGSAFLQSKDGSLWIGTPGALSRVKDGKVTTYEGDGHFAKNFISTIAEDDEGLIVADSEPAVYRFQPGRLRDGKVLPFTLRGQPNPLAQGEYAFTMYFSPNKTLWVGAAHGFFQFAPGADPGAARRSGIGFAVTSIFDDGRGNLWLGGRIAGIVQYRISDGRVTHYARRDGLFDGYATGIVADADGDLWISAETGIYEARLADLDDFAEGRATHVPATNYGLADGLRTTAANDTASQPGAARTADGRLWFTSLKGLVVVDPRHLVRNPIAPPVVVESVVDDRGRRPMGDRVVIAPGVKSIEFHYTALSLRVPERVRFKYRLDGYDQDWVDAGARRVAYYTNLRPGEYRFQVIAANDDGVWNQQGASVGVQLEPCFYQTIWFYCLCALAAVLAGIGANRLNTKRIRNRADELSRLVEERTAELLESQRELEHLAHFDTLTTLPNRRMFNEYFARMQSASQDREGKFSLLLIDFDRFKHINDTYGHDAGDAFLIEASARLKAAVRATDCVSRLGGDEFAILLPGDHDAEAIERVCDRIVQNCAAPVMFNSVTILSSASVGVAIFPDDGDTQELIYKCADLALYEAKRAGRNNWRWYCQEPQSGSLVGS
jgi:diguanylate cyclase (GGDEF)-like protein